MLEIYEFERAPEPSKRIKKPKGSTERAVKARTRRVSNVARYQKCFRRLVRSNLGSTGNPAFLTLTMLGCVPIQEAYHFLTSFFKGLRVQWGKDFRYIAVPEFQKRGAVHFHILIWGVPLGYVENERDTRYLQRRWLYGYVDIIPTDGSYKLVGYLAKYMSKAVSDIRLLGKKAFSCSRNCLRPLSLSGAIQTSYTDEIMGVDKSLDYHDQFKTLWLGMCDYKVYKLIV